ncbi:hypothetical protein [Streptomyces apocyni]|uniref:hypothetical protein n=1 Tax=Streptomyces apocyni TaxID=2654677 RepID=UPI0012E9BAEC|nr:hypothetical protein [Streptomyces apocyni]
MPPKPEPCRSVRSADVVNEQIRALWTRAGGRLGTDQRREYERLIAEWAAAVRHESAQPPARRRTPRGPNRPRRVIDTATRR